MTAEATRLSRNRTRELLNEYKMARGCQDCGYKKHPRALEFDHVRGEKAFGIATAVSQTKSLEVILTEIEKCEVVCANCHAIRTALRHGGDE